MKEKMAELVIKIIGCFALVFGALCWLRPMREYLSTGYQELLWGFFFTLLATAIGVFLAFRVESLRERELELRNFKRSFASIMLESAENQAKINQFKKEVSQTHFNLTKLDVELSSAIVGNPSFYKWTGDEYWYAVKTYIETCHLANRMVDFVFDDFKQDGQIIPKNLEDLRQKLDQALRYTYILQMQTQLYIQAYDVRTGPKAGNYQEVMDLLKGKCTDSLEEIKAKTGQIENMSEVEKRELRRSLERVLGE